MDETEFYALALGAARRHAPPAPHEIDFGAWATLATSSEDATEKGMAAARERWPESEGWREHCVSLCVVERGFLREALRDLDASDAEEMVGNDDTFETIMYAERLSRWYHTCLCSDAVSEGLEKVVTVSNELLPSVTSGR